MRIWAILSGVILLTSGLGIAQHNAKTISSPESLAGRWEAPDGHGGAVGMNILLTTTIPSASEDFLKQPQVEEEFTVGLYQRTGSNVEPLGFEFFTDSSYGNRWDGRRLVISFTENADHPNDNVDLVWHSESKTWSGLFERDSFRKQVVLHRPSSTTAKSSFVGTWFEVNGLMNNCLHIAQQQDGTLTGWSDDIMVPGRVRYANGLLPPAQTLEHYGEIAKIQLDAPDQVTAELRAYTAGCCSHLFTAKISPDGRVLSGNWLGGPNQVQGVVEWEKVASNSCLAESFSKVRQRPD